MDFIKFKNAVSERFAQMAKTGLFRVDVTKDKLWETYLGSFPEGSNPIFRERTEHDCNCCKQFIRAVGDVVTVVDNRVISIWDIDIGKKEPEYQVVADAMATLVRSRPIINQFLHYENRAGTEKSMEDMVDHVHVWNHFHVNIPDGRNRQRNYVTPKARIDTVLGESRSTYDVLYRGLKEIDMDTVDTVLELIAQNSIYRGQEHKFAVDSFRKLKAEFDRLPEEQRNAYVWSLVDGATPQSVLRIRNTVIGTLLTDLSSGVDLETAVKTFESKVAPTNYKRPTALVTKDMIRRAQETIQELGLTSALERRYATMTDITVNNILFANRASKRVINGDVFDDLMSDVKPGKAKTLDRMEEVPIAAFIKDILPTAESVEVLVENNHLSNLVSLIAPVDPGAGRLFKWDNNFSWTYSGDVTDSIKERVKRAGGNVTGDFCCRLSWHNYDDLDFHMHEPTGEHIYFGVRGRKTSSGGMLDVDMNAGGGHTREPVENIFYESLGKMKPGRYRLEVHNFNRRETKDTGFEVEIDIMGTVYNFSRANNPKERESITVAEFEYSKEKGLTVVTKLDGRAVSKTAWGITTQEFRPVNVIMLSPNHWDGQGVGNQHYFFMLDGCRNEEKARGFYNEFLSSELDKHRKVLEMVGAKVRTDESAEQLSGLGFSSTQRNSLVCRVKGKFTRTIKVLF